MYLVKCPNSWAPSAQSQFTLRYKDMAFAWRRFGTISDMMTQTTAPGPTANPAMKDSTAATATAPCQPMSQCHVDVDIGVTVTGRFRRDKWHFNVPGYLNPQLPCHRNSNVTIRQSNFLLMELLEHMGQEGWPKFVTHRIHKRLSEYSLGPGGEVVCNSSREAPNLEAVKMYCKEKCYTLPPQQTRIVFGAGWIRARSMCETSRVYEWVEYIRCAASLGSRDANYGANDAACW